MSKKWLILIMACGLAVPSLAAEVDEPSKLEERIITEGEFAILYCIAIQAEEPRDGWTAEEAIAVLTSFKVEHPEGWQPEADLIEGVMIELVHYAGIELVTPYPDRPVTVRRANAVFHKFHSFFNDFHPEHRTVTGEKATFIEYEGNPGGPFSPSQIP
ncbi:MAG: hypothetical protein JSV08_00845 [Acidobacteriota bacterium]|nr:MAG: hypothetical protein JSV08_00845 [Acidobacteriota bacterium]